MEIVPKEQCQSMPDALYRDERVVNFPQATNELDQL